MNNYKQQIKELCIFFLNEGRDEKTILATLEDLLTPHELISIAERLQILKKLVQGKTHREIAQNLKISIGKVSRGSRILQYGKRNWEQILHAPKTYHDKSVDKTL